MWNPLSLFGGRRTRAARGGSTVVTVPDRTRFESAEWSPGGPDGMSSSQFLTLTSYMTGRIDPQTRPDQVPLDILETMIWDPYVYLGESAITAPVKDQGLYRIQHKDPGIVREYEEAFRCLKAQLLCTIARAFGLGSLPYVFEWEERDLQITVEAAPTAMEPGKLRSKRVHGFYYSDLFDLWLDDVELRVDPKSRRKLVGIHYGEKEYGVDRAFVSVWDRTWGTFRGNGARRRAFRPWLENELIRLWEGRYLERSVDSPRIGYGPAGTVKVGGKTLDGLQVLNRAMMGLKGGGAITFPSLRDKDGNLLWSMEKLDFPEREALFSLAINRRNSEKLFAYLAPPTPLGVDSAPQAGARVAKDLGVEFVQGLANWIASEFTKCLAAVHAVNYGSRIPAPVCVARKLPQARQKLLKDLFQQSKDAKHRLEDGREYTLAELISPELLDELEVPHASPQEAAHKPAPPPPGLMGRPREAMSDREERRENARTPEGEDATGQPEEGEE